MIDDGRRESNPHYPNDRFPRSVAEHETEVRQDIVNGSGESEPTTIAPRQDGRGGLIADRMPWLDLPPPWDNLEIRVWLDYPKEIADLWVKPDNETKEDADARVMMACQQIFLDHRAACIPGRDAKGQIHSADPQTCKAVHEPWRDGQGPLPETQGSEFWERISTPLGAAIVTRFSEEMTINPTSRASRRRKKGSLRRR